MSLLLGVIVLEYLFFDKNDKRFIVIPEKGDKLRWVLFVGDGDMRKQITSESMQKVYDFIFSLNINLMFKGHRGELCKVPRCIKKLEEYVPCELYLKYFDVVISGFSGVIKFSVLMDIETISYLNLVEFIDDSLYNVWKSRLDLYSNGKLLYPETFDVFRDIVLDGLDKE